MGPLRRIAAAATAVACLAVTGCHGGAPKLDQQVGLSWQEVALPPLAPGEHAAVRAATACAGRWYLTGAVVAADGTTRPAAWMSLDTLQWSSLTLEPNTYYGQLNTLYAAGCRFGFLAAIGAKSGGAHGFPRTSNWYQGADGVVRQVEAPYTLYGGPDGVNVSRIVAGPAAWVETGNRVSGAAAWVSPDAETFRLVDNAPDLLTNDRVRTWASDVVATADGWMIVGSVTATDRADPDPAAWVSTDGLSWRRVEVPATGEYEQVQRAVSTDPWVVGIGPRGATFGAWRGDASSWHQAGRFGASGGVGQGFAAGLTVAGGDLVAATADGTSYTLWDSGDGGRNWRRVIMPTAAGVGVDKAVVVVGYGPTVVLVTDNATVSRVWTANVGPS